MAQRHEGQLHRPYEVPCVLPLRLNLVPQRSASLKLAVTLDEVTRDQGIAKAKVAMQSCNLAHPSQKSFQLLAQYGLHHGQFHCEPSYGWLSCASRKSLPLKEDLRLPIRHLTISLDFIAFALVLVYEEQWAKEYCCLHLRYGSLFGMV